MAKRKKDGRANNGRPGKGLSEVEVKIRMPKNLLEVVDRLAVQSGSPRSQWMREALVSRVGREIMRDIALGVTTGPVGSGR